MINSDFPDYDPEIAREFGTDAVQQGAQLFGIPLFDANSLWQLLFRFVVNFIVCWLIIGLFYYRKSKRRDYYFTFMTFSITIFLLIFLMDNVKVQIGFALGLFAIFGMIRYRTEQIPIREMTYLFVIIGISVINGLAMTVSYAELGVTNLIFILTVWFFEQNKRIKHVDTKIVLYEKIELVKVGREAELKADLIERTGLPIIKVEVGYIDFLKDAAYVKIYYTPIPGRDNTIGNVAKPNRFS